ncbi:hypothetical protein VNO77_33991 [Canavalia gladiata]|uniref:Uncharacterized protein n=1 Tax=Canavalia gladiata TaxID=3824 RepID=A0AAN9KGT4_CANGL
MVVTRSRRTEVQIRDRKASQAPMVTHTSLEFESSLWLVGTRSSPLSLFHTHKTPHFDQYPSPIGFKTGAAMRCRGSIWDSDTTSRPS